jgi:hypothetical protein
VIRLTPEESEIFWDTILNPPEPSEALKAAVRQGVEMARALARDGVITDVIELP